MIRLIGTIGLTVLHIICNLYMHIKKEEIRWFYTIYSTLVIVIYILFAWIIFS